MCFCDPFFPLEVTFCHFSLISLAAILMLQKRMSEDMKDLIESFHLATRYSYFLDKRAFFPCEFQYEIGSKIICVYSSHQKQIFIRKKEIRLHSKGVAN